MSFLRVGLTQSFARPLFSGSRGSLAQVRPDVDHFSYEAETQVLLGKTVLASTVIEELQALATSGQVRLAYFYCKHGDYRMNSFVGVAKGIIGQLLRGNPDLVLQLYDKGNLESGEAILLDRATTKDLLELALDSTKTTYIVIDGIDECGRDDRKEICNFFIQQANAVPAEDFGILRCLFVSQEDGFAKKDLGMVPSIKMLQSYTRDDIKRFIICWVERIEQKHGLLDPTQVPLTDIIMSATKGSYNFYRAACLEVAILILSRRDVLVRKTGYSILVGLAETRRSAKKCPRRSVPRWHG
jgi:hypothetical protein